MYQIKGTIVLAGVLAFAVGCGGGGGREEQMKKAIAQDEAKKEAEKQAKEEEAKQRAMELEMKRQAEEKKANEDYEAAKPAIEPLANLPKKRPKGFAKACSDMLEQHDAFMKKTLKGEELEKWNGEGHDRVLQDMRRACHERPVEVTVCQTEVLKKAPDDANVDHILRLCMEKFGG